MNLTVSFLADQNLYHSLMPLSCRIIWESCQKHQTKVTFSERSQKMKIFTHLYVYKLQRCNNVLCLLFSWNKEWVKVGQHLCPLDSWNRQWHPSRTCPQWLLILVCSCPAGYSVHCFMTKNKAIDMPVLLPSVWTSPKMLLDQFAYLCSYFQGQTALLIKQMVQFWSSVLTTVHNRVLHLYSMQR